DLATWSDAMAKISTALHKLSGREIAIITSAKLTNEELFMVRRLARLKGIQNVDIVPRNEESDGYLISEDRNPNTTGAKLVLGVDEPGAKLNAIKEGVTSGAIKALLVLQEDLIADAGFTAEDLSGLDLLVSMYPRVNATSDAADVVLPSACWAEKAGSMINVTGRLQRLNQVVDAPGQTLTPWEVVRDLIQALGGGNGIYSEQEIFKQLTKEIAEFKDLSWGKIGDLGIQIVETGVEIPLLKREREKISRGEIVG
ncbi:MAG: molybdopterin-dependent oxidoreductase, partial [Verrucomicrobiota bacterium]